MGERGTAAFQFTSHAAATPGPRVRRLARLRVDTSFRLFLTPRATRVERPQTSYATSLWASAVRCELAEFVLPHDCCRWAGISYYWTVVVYATCRTCDDTFHELTVCQLPRRARRLTIPLYRCLGGTTIDISMLNAFEHYDLRLPFYDLDVLHPAHLFPFERELHFYAVPLLHATRTAFQFWTFAIGLLFPGTRTLRLRSVRLPLCFSAGAATCPIRCCRRA